MLRIAFLFLLPSLVVGTLEEDKTAAFCAFKCLPMTPPPASVPQNCLRLVHNSTATQGDGLWAYDRLVFEGPDCGVYTFVIRTKSGVTMLPVSSTFKIEEEADAVYLPADKVTCLRNCGRGLLDASCTAPKYTIARGSVSYPFGAANPRDGGQTVYRAAQFGCETKTTIIRAYRSEFEVRAVLEGNGYHAGSYSELWSINRGFLQTIPATNNVNHYLATKAETPVEEITDKNVCALNCFNYTNPPYSEAKTCNRTLVNETVSDKNGKWSYDREVLEGPECDGRYTFLITTKSNVSMSIDREGSKEERDFTTTSTTNTPLSDCMRSCGFDVCSPPSLRHSYGDILTLNENDGFASPAYHHAQFDCDGVKHLIVRSFRPETVVRIDLERGEEPKVYSEKWRIKDGQLVTETAPYGNE